MSALISIFMGAGGELRQLENAAITRDLLATNERTAEYGLVLTESQARELVEIRNRSLRENERIELGSGAILQIIDKFCTSSYINSQNYAQTLGELLDIFYYFKTESRDRISDKDLIDIMYELFEGPCHGSTELLAGRDLESLLRYVNEGRDDLLHDPDDDYDTYPEIEEDI
ncbi:MAG TPA: DUF6323 family protein [Bacillota bacterium]|nr:hypothetical protein [Clostridiales bacterium]HPT85570.1 DUF6323 family protein [Bacillota bacterium]